MRLPIFINWAAVTGGASGIPGVPAPTLFGFVADTNSEFIVISTLALVLAATIFWLMMRSVYGRMLNAIRLDEIAAAAAGRDVLAPSSVSRRSPAGSLQWAACCSRSYFSYIDPSSFEIYVSVLFLTMLVVGGARTLVGSILGPLVILAIPQLLALVELPSTIVGPMRQLAYGVILVAFMLLRPQGIAGQKLLMSTILEVDNVSKAFGGLRALRECSFTIESGNATCLVGPNGAGKTTLFDVITGFLKPDSGDVRFKGQSLKGLSRRDVVKTGVARTFQNLRLFPELSVRDNVVVCLADEAGNGAATSILRPFLSACHRQAQRSRGDASSGDRRSRA